MPGFEKVTLPEGRVVTTQHTGTYESMMPAYEGLEKYLKEKGLKKDLMIEQYLSDPVTEKDPAQWKTDIYFTVK